MTTTPEPLLPVLQPKDGSPDDLVATLERLIMLTPFKANARDAQDLHCSVRAVAEAAIDRYRTRLSSTPAPAVPDASGLREAVSDIRLRCGILRAAKYRQAEWDAALDRIDEIADAALSRPTSTASGDGVAVPVGWRTMDSAPKDGTSVLLWLRAPYARVEIAAWCGPWSVWLTDADSYDPDGEICGIGGLVPSHWQPQPDAPLTAAPTTRDGE